MPPLPKVSLFNTLTRRVEPLQPLAPPRVTLYTCGPTVWNYAHIGNFRTFLFEDLLRRWLEHSGYDVFQVMNLTDVDDRTIKAARGAGKPLSEHTAPFTQAFFEDRDYLRIKPAQVYPAATWLDDAKTLARTIAEKPPIAIRLATEAIDLAWNSTLDAGLEFERKAFYLLFSTEDKKEGVDAFMNKRKAVFKGK